MLTLQLAYKPFGVGEWTYTTVSHEVAKSLASEYASYGWYSYDRRIAIRNRKRSCCVSVNYIIADVCRAGC